MCDSGATALVTILVRTKEKTTMSLFINKVWFIHK